VLDVPVPPQQQCITVIIRPQLHSLDKAKVELAVREPPGTSTIFREVLITGESEIDLQYNELCGRRGLKKYLP
jgi:hypothetical protein